MKQKEFNEKIITHFLENNEKIVKYIGNLDGTMRAINDTNMLHKTALDRNSNILNDNTASIKQLVQTNSSFMKIFNILLIVLVAALIILAGAEKALKFLPL